MNRYIIYSDRPQLMIDALEDHIDALRSVLSEDQASQAEEAECKVVIGQLMVQMDQHEGKR